MRIGGSSDWMSGQRPSLRNGRASGRGSTLGSAAGSAPASGADDPTAPPVAAQDVPPASAQPPAPDAPPPVPDTRSTSDDPNLFHQRKESDTSKSATSKSGPGQLTPEQEAEIMELRNRDSEVRAHEAAHAAAAGALGGGASFEYQTGPDGRNYAVGGEVPVEMAAGHTPEETIRNAAQLRAAALAPAQPSAQDRAVAAEASAMEAAARMEIAARSTRASQETTSRAPDVRVLGAPAESPAPPEPRAIAPSDPAQVIQQLEVEQRQSRAGWRHLHSDGGCVTCGQAVAAYR
jgi:hypothetical protein